MNKTEPCDSWVFDSFFAHCPSSISNVVHRIINEITYYDIKSIFVIKIKISCGHVIKVCEFYVNLEAVIGLRTRDVGVGIQDIQMVKRPIHNHDVRTGGVPGGSDHGVHKG